MNTKSRHSRCDQMLKRAHVPTTCHGTSCAGVYNAACLLLQMLCFTYVPELLDGMPESPFRLRENCVHHAENMIMEFAVCRTPRTRSPLLPRHHGHGMPA